VRIMFSYDAKVRYSEVDSRKRLTIPAIVNYLQDTCVFHSEAVGAGLDYVGLVGRVWLLGAWRIEFFDDINFMDEIKLSTWAYMFKSFFGYRNLTIEKKDDFGQDKMCVRADSEWLLYSIKDRRLVKTTDEDTKFYPCKDKIEMEQCKRKLTTEHTLVKTEPIAVKESFIDTNGHVNNGKYVQIAIDTASFEKRVKVLETEYKKQAMLGDTMVPFVYKDDNEAFVSLKDTEDNIYANIKFTF